MSMMMVKTNRNCNVRVQARRGPVTVSDHVLRRVRNHLRSRRPIVVVSAGVDAEPLNGLVLSFEPTLSTCVSFCVYSLAKPI